MKSLLAFIKKEITEQLRTGRLMILSLLFVLFGIMNPAVAKLTPWLLEMMADSLAQSGMTVTSVTVSAMDSWMQFYKNMPMALIAFVLLESSIFTGEYQTGTLVMSLTKGLERYKIVIAKTIILVVLWTLAYWLCFGITCGYNAYFWDNSAAQNLVFSVVCWWVFGLWIISLMTLFSTIAGSNVGVLAGTGGIALAAYLLGLFPQLKEYLPTFLADGNAIISGATETKEFTVSMILTVSISLVCIAVSIPIFRRKLFPK